MLNPSLVVGRERAGNIELVGELGERVEPHHVVAPEEQRGASVGDERYTTGVARDAIHLLLATDVALDKLGARGISAEEVEQLPRNRHVTARNPREGNEPGKRLLLIGRTDGGRLLTLVIERTVEPTTWLIVTGWNSTDAQRRILED